MKSSSKKILLCDDHNLFGQGVKELLALAGHNVVYANSSKKCMKKLTSYKFDVFFCDLRIDNKNGFDLILEMNAHLTETNCFLLTAYREDFLIEKAKKLGFRGYLSKESSIDKLLEAVNLTRSGKFFSLVQSNSEAGPAEIIKDALPITLRLSKQERIIIKGVVSGKTSKEIAAGLFISKTTVDTHRRNIYKKIGVDSVGRLIQFAHENNLCV